MAIKTTVTTTATTKAAAPTGRLVDWRGPAPSATLRRALAEAGWILAGPGRPGAAAIVVATAGARRAPEAPRATLPWLWVSGDAPALAAARDAVARGAYEVIGLGGDDAARLLGMRLDEATTPEPPYPATPGLVAESPAARRMLAQLARAARSAMPVLITGETGTGKEEAAHLVHAWSARRGPFVPVNCAAIPNELMESELFGHARGAFSGAVASVDGKLLAAQGGTVFLDEIDDTPLPTQVKLLRVLEDGQVTRLGETQPIQADFRVVAATNEDLAALIAAHRFGQDLYERLAIVRVALPPLRERREDIPALARHFMARYAARQPRGAEVVSALSARAEEALMAHPWPGNVRELRNVIFGALVYKRAGSELLLGDLPTLGTRRAGADGAAEATDVISEAAVRARIAAGTMNLRAEIDRLERAALSAALAVSGGSAAEAARRLGEVGRGAARDPGGTVRAMRRRLGI